MSAQTFYESSQAHIKAGHWSDLTLCDHPKDNEWLLRQLLDVVVFTQEVYDTIHRLYGPHTPHEWTVILVKHCIHFNPIDLFLQNNALDLTGSPSIMEFVLNHEMYVAEEKKCLLDKLIARGGNVNEIDGRWGNSLMLRYVYNIEHGLLTDHNSEGKSVMEEASILVPYLLEKGANPLLASKTGNTVVRIAQHFHHTSFKNWLVSELERHCF